MIILGIDPGTATTGYGIIKIPDNILEREFEYGIELINYGNISTSKDRIMPERLLLIHDQLNHVIETYKPDAMALEMLFFGANTKTAITVGQARGVILLSAAKYGIPVNDYTGLQVKLMVAGSGRSDKKQVIEAVQKKWLKGGEKNFVTPKGGHMDDAMDALAIAICHVLKLAAK